MLEEALPIALGVGAALLPAMAFGGLAAARAFIYLGAGQPASTALQPLASFIPFIFHFLLITAVSTV